MGSDTSDLAGICEHCGARRLSAEGDCPACLLADAMAKTKGFDPETVARRFPQLDALQCIGLPRSQTPRYQALDLVSGNPVILQLCGIGATLPQREGIDRDLGRRAEIEHPSISKVIDHGPIDGHLYAITELPEGRPLDLAIGEAELSRADVLKILPRVSAAVAFAAGRGVKVPSEPGTIYVDSGRRVTLTGILAEDHGAEPASSWLEEHPAVGTRIGGFELIELIGEGGFAEVYRARQESPVQREVALKILKLGMDTRELLARFAREREALARMSHAGIAQIYDAGATGGGRPFIAMELIDGEAITGFCERRSLPLADRARLMAQVCHAVDYGNRKGVVHRDLKPSNVLVTEQGGKPMPKVIDFGIARAAEQPLASGTFFTRSQQFVGSPSYMSPEQADAGDDIDARSDVFSLGCLLYELLTGTPPLPEDDLSGSGLKSAMDRIQNELPEHPADRVARLSEDGQHSLAKGRGCSPKTLRASLAARGPSEIALKALAKEPRARYESAAAMADDLESWAEGQPVAAPRRRRRRSVRLRKLAVCIGVFAVLAATAWQFNPFKRKPAVSRAPDGTLTPVALFQFDGTLESGVEGGPDMEVTGDPAIAFKTVDIGGEPAQVLHFERFLPTEWLKFENTVGVNGPRWATETNRWTLVMDIMFPTLTGPTALFQCHSENGGEAEMYVAPQGIGSRFGLYYGDIRPGEWYRIAIVSSDNRRAQTYANYVNGSRWGIPWVKGRHSAGYAFDDEILLFCEADQKTGEGYVNSVAFYDVPLTDEEVWALGPPQADGLPATFKPGPQPVPRGTLKARHRIAPTDGQVRDRFSYALAVAGEEALVGIASSDRSGHDSGAIARYRKNAAGRWEVAEALPTPEGLHANSQFGTSIAMSEDIALVGAPVFGGWGKAFLYECDGTRWSISKTLAPDEVWENMSFGTAVAIHGDTLIVAAPRSSGRPGVFLFDRSDGSPRGMLSPTGASDGFGASLAAGGSHIALGYLNGGPVSMFRKAPTEDRWERSAEITPPAGDQGFGRKLALSPDGKVLAASGDGGKAYLFTDSGDRGWVSSGTLPEAGGEMRFTASGELLVGAPEAVWNRRRSGAVFLFERDPAGESTPWTLRRTIVPTGSAEESRFGQSIACDGNTLWVGAPDDHTDRDLGGSAYPLPLPRFEDQALPTIAPMFNRGTDVAIDGALAAAASPGADERVVGGQLQVFQLENNRWTPDSSFPPLYPDEVPRGAFPYVDVASDTVVSCVEDRVYGWKKLEGKWSVSEPLQRFHPSSVLTDGRSALLGHLGGVDTATLEGGQLAEPRALLGDLPLSRPSGIALHDGIAAIPQAWESVHVLKRSEPNANDWQPFAKFQRPDTTPPTAFFPHDCATDGQRIIVGAPTRSRIRFALGENERTGTGIAWIYDLSDTNAPPIPLTCPETGEMPSFGHSVAISGDTALVANPYVDRGLAPGRVYLYRRDPATRTWHHRETLQAQNAEPGDEFGIHLDMDAKSGWAVIGAKTEWVYFFRLE